MADNRSGFEHLRVYQRAEALADLIWRIVRHWNQFDSDTLGKQIVRSADSIGANIAEGCGRGSSNDNRRFVRIARGSLYETRHWLRRAYHRNLLTEEQTAALQPMVGELMPMLNAYLKSIAPKNA